MRLRLSKRKKTLSISGWLLNIFVYCSDFFHVVNWSSWFKWSFSFFFYDVQMIIVMSASERNVRRVDAGCTKVINRNRNRQEKENKTDCACGEMSKK